MRGATVPQDLVARAVRRILRQKAEEQSRNTWRGRLADRWVADAGPTGP